MQAQEIAEHLGGGAARGEWARSPCPVHGGDSDTLALKDGDRALIVKCHAGCDPTEILEALRDLDLVDDWQGAFGRGNAAARDAARREYALSLWAAARPQYRSIVEAYWRSRGITIPLPATIREHSALHHRESGQTWPAQIGLVEHAVHGAVGVHVTWLLPDGSGKAPIKPNKKFFGPIRGGAVRLGAVAPDQCLLVAEGIETAASAMKVFGTPGWAALSEGGMRGLVLPPEARRIRLIVDRDRNGVGQAAAVDAGWLWQRAGLEVRVAIPRNVGDDFNDILKTRGI